eukprot:m.205692 g.205692  ORF g.205692 m.205692 type:complete len:81 (+) comp32921_c1_seq1:496-738(+)
MIGSSIPPANMSKTVPMNTMSISSAHVRRTKDARRVCCGTMGGCGGCGGVFVLRRYGRGSGSDIRVCGCGVGVIDREDDV